MQCGLPGGKRDDAQPSREPLWKRRWAGVEILAAVLPDLRGACSEWEDALLAKAGTHTCLRIKSAQVVPQTDLDLRAVVGATAAAGQHRGECQRSEQEDTDRPHT